MRSKLYKSPLLLSALTTCFIASEMTRTANAQQPPPPQQRTAESQTDAEAETVLRGPLHEAFAEPVQPNPTPTMTIPKQPPEPIDEIPPVAKPADENVVWISGYWAWDDDRDDFLWISGVWRVPPPDRRWVPGYWAQAEGGAQWVSGFWSPIEAQEISYLPPPPESLDEGPTSRPPSEDSYWVSGCWIYHDNDYAWRPGYWGSYRAGWVWLPAHYIWTPRGVIFVEGYWDYPLVTRGQIFAPVYFRGDFYRRPGYRYSPSVSVNIGNLMIHLFVRPRYHHYYWGDYYGDRYHQAGFLVWSDFGYRRNYHDPLFAYYQTHFSRRGINYAQRLGGWHEYYRRHEDRRPARTMSAQTQLAARVDSDAQVQHSLLGQPIEELMSDRNANRRFRRLEDRERESLAESTNELRGLTRQRVEIEAGQKTRSETDQPATGRRPATPEGKFRLPETRRFSPSDETRRPPARSPRRGDDLPGRRTPRAPETETETLIPEVDPAKRPGTPEVPSREDRPRQQIPPRETEPRTPGRQPRPDSDPPRTPQPEFERPETPELPKVDPPNRPKQPEVERPETPTPRRQPEVERPDTPRQPEVERPRTPRRQPEVERPNTPRQPEVERPRTPRRLPREDRIIESPSRRLPL